jgi:hypothetical protein
MSRPVSWIPSICKHCEVRGIHPPDDVDTETSSGCATLRDVAAKHLAMATCPKALILLIEARLHLCRAVLTIHLLSVADNAVSERKNLANLLERVPQFAPSRYNARLQHMVLRDPRLLRNPNGISGKCLLLTHTDRAPCSALVNLLSIGNMVKGKRQRRSTSET